MRHAIGRGGGGRTFVVRWYVRKSDVCVKQTTPLLLEELKEGPKGQRHGCGGGGTEAAPSSSCAVNLFSNGRPPGSAGTRRVPGGNRPNSHARHVVLMVLWPQITPTMSRGVVGCVTGSTLLLCPVVINRPTPTRSLTRRGHDTTRL
jgi:hypothetical protein